MKRLKLSDIRPGFVLDDPKGTRWHVSYDRLNENIYWLVNENFVCWTDEYGVAFHQAEFFIAMIEIHGWHDPEVDAKISYLPFVEIPSESFKN